MSLSCKCSTINEGNKQHTVRIELDLSDYPPSQKILLGSGDYEWMPVNQFERMLGLRRQTVKGLINSGELVSYEIPQNPSTKLGYGRRAFVAVQKLPCASCFPDHYNFAWEEHERITKSDR
jgi:hypothetical protein